MLSDRYNTRAAYRFLSKPPTAVCGVPPSSVSAVKLAVSPKAIRRLQREGHLALLVIGYPAEGCTVPMYDGIKKPLEQIAS